MNYQIERIQFPYDSIPGVLAANKDGKSYTIYLNILCSDAQCEKALRLLVEEISKEVAV